MPNLVGVTTTLQTDPSSVEAQPFGDLAVVGGKGSHEAVNYFSSIHCLYAGDPTDSSLIGCLPEVPVTGIGLGNSRQLLSSSANVEDLTAC